MRATTITGYSDKISAEAGETIRFMVSSEGDRPYEASLVRVVCGDLNPAGPGYREVAIPSAIDGTHPGRHQPMHAGSAVLVPNAPAIVGAFTVQAAVWPTLPGRGEQVVLSLWSPRRGAGFQLLLDEDGALALRIGDGAGRVEAVSTDAPLRAQAWYFVSATYEPEGGVVTLHQRMRDPQALEAPTLTVVRPVGVLPGAAEGPLVIAARHGGTGRGGRLLTTAHYNGRIEAPRLFGRALAIEESVAAAARAVPAALRPDLLGAWDFALEIPTTRIVDVSGQGRHGETVNLPTRAVTGQHWSGREMRWTDAPHEYAAIHFHDDDVYDAGWEEDFALTIPEDLPSGAYAVKVESGGHEDYMPFFVRRPVGRPTAKILYLAQTATYLAYANFSGGFLAPAMELLANRVQTIQPWEEYLNAHPELGASLYDVHSDGSGVCHSSRLRPVMNMRPKVQTSSAGFGSSLWAYNADTHLTDWLEAKGYAFDVATDEDLHRDGAALLAGYRVVLTGTHPEYYSLAMLDALTDYTAAGGRLMYMGGNGFYWRIAYHPTLPGVIEIRRAEDGTRAWIARPGEFWHAFTAEYGGLWRRQDRAPQKLAGVGFIAQGFDFSASYHRTPESEDPRVAFAFEGIGRDETIGDFGLIGNGAAGLEVDIADPTLGTPPHTLVIAQSNELPDTFLLVNEEQTISTPDTLGSTNPRIRSDIAFHETGRGGAVFSFSSMAWCGSLAHNGYDNNVSRLTANVLNRFMSDEPL